MKTSEPDRPIKARGRAVPKKPLCSPHPKAKFLSLFLIWRLKKKPQHGYSLLKEVREIEMSPSKPSTLYALLAKLEKGGMVRSTYDKTGPHVRRTYQTTARGWALFMEIKKRRMQGVFREFVREMAD